MKEFYVTLISNSSLEVYPYNKASAFIVQLPQKIILNDNWVVGLAEIQYSYNFFNVSESNNTLTYTKGSEVSIRSIEIGFYKSISDIIIAVRKATSELGDWIKIDSITNRIIINTKEVYSDEKESTSNRSIKFHGLLALQLGFAPDTNVLNYDISPYVGNTYFGIPDEIFVYCDLIEPQLVGYQSSQVLKIVNTGDKRTTFGTSCFRGFQNLHYVPLLKKDFDKVEIELRDITGQYIPFRHGITRIKLHFKEVKKDIN